MADPLGRKHQTVRKPQNRSVVDHVCNFVLTHHWEEFEKKPATTHVYFSAYSVIFGSTAAYEMLEKARKK